VIRWLLESKKLSREQLRVLDEAERRAVPVCASAITLLEIALLASEGRLRSNTSADTVFDQLRANPGFQVLPVSYEIASEVAALGPALRDPMDRVIVATARIHGLRLLTSDQRIIDSKLIPVLE
jgi:PIN domain nuclease of toxin-antitoxin system